MKEREWYAVYTHTGKEKIVKTRIEQRTNSMNMQDKIFHVLFPVREKISYRDGQKVIKNQKVFPGYLLVEMIMCKETLYLIKSTSGVNGFAGSGAMPIPLKEEEIKVILTELDLLPKINLEIGQLVKITDGPLKGLDGTVEDIDSKKEIIKVTVPMFGQEVSVEVNASQAISL